MSKGTRMFSEKKGDSYSYTCIWNEYTDEALAAGWEDRGQGSSQALGRGQDCVVIKMGRDNALIMTRMFMREFAIPSCAHYDGDTLSLFCGHTGHTRVEALMQRMVDLWCSGLKAGEDDGIVKL